MRHLLVMFLAVTLLLTATLVWLSWQLVRQDEALVEQRIEERRESAADLATAALQKSLLQAGEQLSALSVTPARELSGKADDIAKRLGADSVLIICRPRQRRGVPRRAAALLPRQAAVGAVGRAQRVRAGRVARVPPREHAGGGGRPARPGSRGRPGDPRGRAHAARQDPSQERPPARGAGRLRDAWRRWARCRWRASRRIWSRATRAWRSLETLGERDRLAREASALLRDVQAGRWRLLRAEYGFYVGGSAAAARIVRSPAKDRRLPWRGPSRSSRCGNPGAPSCRGKKPPRVSGFCGSATGPSWCCGARRPG